VTIRKGNASRVHQLISFLATLKFITLRTVLLIEILCEFSLPLASAALVNQTDGCEFNVIAGTDELSVISFRSSSYGDSDNFTDR